MGGCFAFSLTFKTIKMYINEYRLGKNCCMSLMVRFFHLNSPVSHCIARALGWKSHPLVFMMLTDMINVKMLKLAFFILYIQNEVKIKLYKVIFDHSRISCVSLFKLFLFLSTFVYSVSLLSLNPMKCMLYSSFLHKWC